LRVQAASASRTVAVSSSSATGSEARSAQSSAAAISGGGSVSRVAGLNAQANSACPQHPGLAWFLGGEGDGDGDQGLGDRAAETGARFGHLA
jgi:hypothetical protein